MIRHIPNGLTLLNLVCGFAATIYAIKGYNDYASYCIMAGMVLDFSDGFAARLLKAYSDIGKDLDSLADVVTFGIAPGAIVMNLLTGGGMSFLPAFAVAALIPAASALRLAKFNNDTTQVTTFRGMATPASAFTVVSVVLAAAFTDSQIYDTMTASPLIISLLAFFLAVMMLLNVPMFSLKLTGIRWKGNEERYLFAGISLVLLAVFRVSALPMIMAAYILISLLFPLAAGRRAGPGAA
ncbi:MAG: CDP-alcohol phosphatidyltransferase family protein [Bacteroidales bacterium]|jgi:CDP-diacylglycerol--serine O-phosphatidyltransferase|nr:CDP-alcohol phosphatidyltransferase family protein [Bacteroidales bacterium]